MKNKLVNIHEDYVENKQLPESVGLVLRGPYEHVIKLTPEYSSCEPMYDLLIAGKIYKMVPCAYCTKILK